MRDGALSLVAIATAVLLAAQRPPTRSTDTARKPETSTMAEKVRAPYVKLGLWETTATTTSQGTMPLAESVLARLTPEQRARVEAKLKADSAARTSNKTYRSCLTEQQLDDWRLYDSPDANCKQTIKTSTSRVLEGYWDCDMGPGVKGSGTVHLQVVDPKTTKGAVHLTTRANGKKFTSDTSLSSRWLRSDCGSVQ